MGVMPAAASSHGPGGHPHPLSPESVAGTTHSRGNTRSIRCDNRDVTDCHCSGGPHMMTRIPFPVIARHDIRQSAAFIRSGTPGEITGVSGAQPSYYTVTFWPRGADSASVTLSYLTTSDLSEA